MTEQPKPTKRKLIPRKYAPPQEVRQRIMDKDKDRPHGNRYANWIKTFFGEGF